MLHITANFDIVDLYNCSIVFRNVTRLFNVQCLGPTNFTNANITTNAILYNCPLDCFFNRSITMIDMSRTINATRLQIGMNVSYYLSSNLFPNFHAICGKKSFRATLMVTSVSIVMLVSIFVK